VVDDGDPVAHVDLGVASAGRCGDGVAEVAPVVLLESLNGGR
jgi:hypothetical protein